MIEGLLIGGALALGAFALGAFYAAVVTTPRDLAAPEKWRRYPHD